MTTERPAATNTPRATLEEQTLRHLTREPTVLDHGMFLICRRGTATVHVNLSTFQPRKDAVLTLFSNDAVSAEHISSEFLVESLTYAAALLREASLQLEQTVYTQLRQDRCCSGSQTVSRIVNSMFSLLHI